jgi:hypothetical protein
VAQVRWPWRRSGQHPCRRQGHVVVVAWLVEVASWGGNSASAFPQMRARRGSRSRAGGCPHLVQGERGETAARALAASQMRASSRCDRGVVGSLTACVIDVRAGAAACRARRRSGFDRDGAGVLAGLVGRPDEVLDAVAAMPVSAPRRYRWAAAAAADGEALAIRGRQPAAARRLPQAGAQRRPRAAPTGPHDPATFPRDRPLAAPTATPLTHHKLRGVFPDPTTAGFTHDPG